MIKILGNRILVSRVEEEKTEGFQTVNVQDSFVNKGMVEQIGDNLMQKKDYDNEVEKVGMPVLVTHGRVVSCNVGDIVLFSKYSPDTQEVKHEGKDMKIISVSDILAIL